MSLEHFERIAEKNEITETAKETMKQRAEGHVLDESQLPKEKELNEMAEENPAEISGGTGADYGNIEFSEVKICATRHGCSGATNCDYSMGSPVGH